MVTAVVSRSGIGGGGSCSGGGEGDVMWCVWWGKGTQ